MNRRHIVRAAKQRGWMLHPAALEGIERLLSDDADDLEALFEFVSTHMSGNTTVTEAIWQQVADALVKDTRDEVMLPAKNPFPDLEVISAFRTPRLVYRPTRKQFQVEESRWSLFGEAEDKVRLILCYKKRKRILITTAVYLTFLRAIFLDKHAGTKILPGPTTDTAS